MEFNGSEIRGQETNDLMRVCSLNGDGNIIAVSSPFNDGPLSSMDK